MAQLSTISRWSVWQDQRASRVDGATQGNGGKAYLFRMFSGEARLLGVREGKRSCKAFEGAPDSSERGTPGFMPNVASGRQAPVSSLLAELDDVLKPYRLSRIDLPMPLLSAIHRSRRFHHLGRCCPQDFWRGRIAGEDLIQSTLLHEQAAFVIEQVHVYAIHNGEALNAGKPLELDLIAPFPGFEVSRILEIPDLLSDQDGSLQSTTLDGQKPRGRLILQTSKTTWIPTGSVCALGGKLRTEHIRSIPLGQNVSPSWSPRLPVAPTYTPPSIYQPSIPTTWSSVACGRMTAH